MCRGPAGTVTTIDASIEGIRFGLTLRYITDPHEEQSATNLPRLGAIGWYSIMSAAGVLGARHRMQNISPGRQGRLACPRRPRTHRHFSGLEID